jgi:carbon monoxide dehydrogenase subunit G
MTLLKETATTSLSPAEAFAHVGDFANVDQWDPGVVRSVKNTAGEVSVGTVYDLVLDYRGRELEMQYELTAYEPAKRIVLVGTGGPVHAVDTISFEPNGAGTLVTYEADLRLRGMASIIQPLMKSRFQAIGEAGGVGLRRWLHELENQPA